MKTTFALAVARMFLLIAPAMTAFAASQTNQVRFRYIPPKNPAHQWVYKGLKERRVLEKLQELLSPLDFSGS
jgi:hypothetical protein